MTQETDPEQNPYQSPGATMGGDSGDGSSRPKRRLSPVLIIVGIVLIAIGASIAPIMSKFARMFREFDMSSLPGSFTLLFGGYLPPVTLGVLGIGYLIAGIFPRRLSFILIMIMTVLAIIVMMMSIRGVVLLMEQIR